MSLINEHIPSNQIQMKNCLWIEQTKEMSRREREWVRNERFYVYPSGVALNETIQIKQKWLINT